MRKSRRSAALALIAALLLPLTAQAQAAIPAPQPRWWEKTFDAAVVRPLSFAALAVGTGLFIPAAVLVAPSGKHNLQTALEHFVLEPYNATFVRPLGKIQ